MANHIHVQNACSLQAGDHRLWPNTPVHDIGLPKDHIIYTTDYRYTYRLDNKSHLDGYSAPKLFGVFTTEEFDKDVVRENALKYLFPRLANEYYKFRG